jgi:hypothetical protein
MDTVSAETVQAIWTITLVIYLIVIIAVAVLLTLILGAAREIRAGVSEIWTVGQQVANNTIHIALLDSTVHVAGSILGCAKGIFREVAALTAHAEGCPECPACVTGHGGAR